LYSYKDFHWLFLRLNLKNMKTILPDFLKRMLLFFSFSSMAFASAFSQTEISGDITKDSVLSVAGSPYIISSYLQIQSGITMTIESGVIVEFDGFSSLYVNGTLNATGVIFTTKDNAPEPGKWGSIQVGNEYDNASLNLTDCEIKYADQMSVNHGTATFNNTNLSNFKTNGINVSGGGILVMTGGAIATSSTNARESYSGVLAGSNSQVTLSGVNIQNYNFGVSLEHNSTVSLSDMHITACGFPVSYNDVSKLSIGGNNTFSGNTNTAFKINFNYLNASMSLPKITIPYFFQWGFNIQEFGNLVVGSNNVLKIAEGYGINVSGALNADADNDEFIYFTSYKDDNWGGDTNKDGTATAPYSKAWSGIRFEDSSVDANCVLRRCMVRYAGANEKGGINMYNASPTIDSCDISNNYIGIYMQGTSNPVLTNITIGSSEMTPLAMSFEANPIMMNNTLSFSDNAYDAIGIIGGEVTANATLKKRSVTSVPNITYLLLDEITVPSGKTLTINKGITIKSYSSDWYYHRIIVNGTLIANATADSIINFTSARDDNYGYPADCNKDGTITSPVVGDWGGIVFATGSHGIMNNCRIKYARISNFSFTSCNVTEWINNAAIGIIDADPTISNCEFKDLYHAISCYRSASPTLSNLSMVNVLYTPINISSSSNPTISGITFTNVGWQAMGLLGGNVCLNGTIKKRDIAGFTNMTYVLLSNINIYSGTYVNVEPGVVIKCANGYNYFEGRNIYVGGGFRVDGLPNQKVVFTSIKDDNAGNPSDTNGDGNATKPLAGDWGSIKYYSTTDDAYNVINNALVKYPGYSEEGGVTFENASGTLKNTLITNSSNYGVYCNGNATPDIDSVTIQNCSLDPVAMSLTANPSFSNITFTSNFSQAIKIIEGTLSSVATLAPRTMAGIANIAYVIDQLTVSSNAKLTILPDVVIKFRGDHNYNTFIKVNGNLIAKGTPTHKIYFTSFKDDSKGGDSNNNGNTNSPEKGDWGQGYFAYDWSNFPGGIYFVDNTAVADSINVLSNCEISYPSTGIRVERAHATIDSCTIQLCSSFGASVIGSANPDIRNTNFYNISFTPIELSMFSNPSFVNCSALNVGYMALAVVPETFSQTATIPVRNFGDYTNIGYLMEGTCTVNSGSTITIPAGVVFKSISQIPSGAQNYYYGSGEMANGFIVNGKLNIEGSKNNPVVFTHATDDNYGNPKDMNQDGSASRSPNGTNDTWNGNWLTFNDISDDQSSVKNVIFKYGNRGIQTNSASPAVKNTRFENLYYGVDMNGVSAPKIDSCVFNDLLYYPVQISLVSYPASTLGNLISGKTYKVIKVRDETLTQDVVLPKRDFGGKTNIPYFFENYIIGTSASLTIKPGVICKFLRPDWWQESGFNISRGLTAIGGPTPDSLIVFTSLLDDFYGGDSNSDSTKTSPLPSNWTCLNFTNQALDPLCKMKNCIIRYAWSGVNTISASPSIDNCNFNNNVNGLNITAASNPVVTNCDFSENQDYAIANVDKSFVIHAENCWWGSNEGPIESDNETDESGLTEQEYVTSAVDYTPWRTAGSINPLTGDVSLNGLVQAYDASLILKKVVGLVTFSDKQAQVADVSGNAEISAYDASLVLQYVVGLNAYFPVNKVSKLRNAVSENASLSIGSSSITGNEEISIPVNIVNSSDLFSADIRIRFNPAYLEALDVTGLNPSLQTAFRIDNTAGLIYIAMAGGTAVNHADLLASLKFRAIASRTVLTELTVEQFLVNEQNRTDFTNPGSISIVRIQTDLESVQTEQGMEAIYPNPLVGEATLVYHLDKTSKWVNIQLFNMIGQKVALLIDKSVEAGTYSITISDKDYPLQAGSYVIRMNTSNFTQTQKFQVGK